MSDEICKAPGFTHAGMPFCAGCSKCCACYPHHDCEACDREHNPANYQDSDTEAVDDPFVTAKKVTVVVVVEHEDDERIKPVDTDGYAFVFSGGGDFDDATAYIIRCGAGNTTVHHQWDCNSCSQFEQENCKLYSWDGPLAEELKEAMSCQARDRDDDITELVRGRWPDAEVSVYGEALVRVNTEELGEFYIATCNCD